MIADIFSTPQLYTFDTRNEVTQTGGVEELPSPEDEIISVDVTISEEYAHDFEVATNPVEVGINVADHKRARPIMLRMSGIVSDSPNNVLDVLGGNLSGTLGASLNDSGNETNTRSLDAYTRLRALAERQEPLRVITRLGEYKDMTFSSFRVQKDDAGRYLGFSAVLEQIRFVKPAFGIFIPEVEHSASPEASAFKQPPQLDNTSVAAAVVEGGDAAIQATPGGVVDKTIEGVKGIYNAVVNGGVRPVVP